MTTPEPVEAGHEPEALDVTRNGKTLTWDIKDLSVRHVEIVRIVETARTGIRSVGIAKELKRRLNDSRQYSPMGVGQMAARLAAAGLIKSAFNNGERVWFPANATEATMRTSLDGTTVLTGPKAKTAVASVLEPSFELNVTVPLSSIPTAALMAELQRRIEGGFK